VRSDGRRAAGIPIAERRWAPGLLALRRRRVALVRPRGEGIDL